MSQKVTVAAAHLAPVYLDTQATVDKVCAYILEAANAGVQLIAFPESFIPGFPVWPAVSPPIYNHNLFSTFASQSLHVPGPEILKICTVAKKFYHSSQKCPRNCRMPHVNLKSSSKVNHVTPKRHQSSSKL